MVKEQLTLGFAWKNFFSFDNYCSASNEAAIHYLSQNLMQVNPPDSVANHSGPAHKANDNFVYLWGKVGSGKSHLLQAACQQAADLTLSVAYLPLLEIGELHPEMFTGLEQLSLVCIDDVQALAGNAQCEEALFHLYNRMREAGSSLLVAGDVAPSALSITLADLQSRLAWGPVFHLQDLNDENKITALQLRAKTRGFELTEEVGQFLIRRSARDMRSLFNLLDRLDEASLSQHRKLTIPFVRDLI
jgi:DnaA family protein